MIELITMEVNYAIICGLLSVGIICTLDKIIELRKQIKEEKKAK